MKFNMHWIETVFPVFPLKISLMINFFFIIFSPAIIIILFQNVSEGQSILNTFLRSARKGGIAYDATPS